MTSSKVYDGVGFLKLNKIGLLRLLVLSVLVFLISLTLQKSIALIGLDLHHDLLMFDASRKAFYGAIPYKDFFYQYNIATLLLHLVALKVWGLYISSLKIATCYVYALIASLIFLCSSMIARLRNALIFALIWALLSPFYMPAMNGYHAWATVYMMASVMFGAFFLFVWLRTKDNLSPILAGALFSLAFWFKQVAAIQIVFVLIWFVILYINERRRISNQKLNLFKLILSFTAGGLLVASIFFIYLFRNDAISDWLRSAFEFNKLFALTSDSSSSNFRFIKNLFPITKDLGYISVVWTVVPLFLLSKIVNAKLFLDVTGSSFDRYSKSLLCLLGVAGWVEYFPLAHAFHTHLFMAPVFCLLASELFSLNWTIKEYKSIVAAVFVSLIFGYEVAAHMVGFVKKNSQELSEVMIESPASSLRLSDSNYLEYLSFYNEMLRLNEKQKKGLLAFSADPLEALLPTKNNSNLASKMGLNWSWPNEVVEPGYNQKLFDQLSTRSSNFYADGILAAGGYIPTRLLEMQSPLGKFHTLYSPSYATTKLETDYLNQFQVASISKVSNYIFSNEVSYSKVNESSGYYIFRVKRDLKSSNLSTDDVQNINLVFLDDNEIPHKLNEYQFNLYLKKLNPKGALLYQKRKGFWILKNNIPSNEVFSLAQWYLKTGKLFDKQDKPRFSSSLIKRFSEQPVLLLHENDEYKIAWSKFTPVASENLSGLYIGFSNENFPLVGSGTIYVQIVLNDQSTREWFVRED